MQDVGMGMGMDMEMEMEMEMDRGILLGAHMSRRGGGGKGVQSSRSDWGLASMQ